METMDRVYHFESWEQVRAMADPLRVRILKTLRNQALSAHQLSIALEEELPVIDEHLEFLEAQALVRVVPGKKKRPVSDKVYQAVAVHFEINRKDLPPGGSGMGVFESLFLTGLQVTLEESREAIESGLFTRKEGQPNAQIFRLRLEGTPEEILDWTMKLRALAEEGRDSLADEGRATFAASIAVYPLVPPGKKRRL